MSAAQRGRYLKSTTLKANGQVFAEWNINRVSGGATVINHLVAEQPEDDFFSIKSVSKVDRPPRGIVKAMTSGATAAGAGTVSSVLDDMRAGSTAYVALLSDQYKYYISPSPSAGSASGSGGYATSQAGVELTYLESNPCNKIVIGFETGVSTPKKIVVEYRAGGVWQSTTITDPAVDDEGRVVLWRQSNGSFSQNYFLSTNAISINGLRVTVEEVTTPNSYVAIIEVSPRLVVDVSDYVIDLSYEASISDDSKVAPLGVASSNVGSLSLDNSDRYFSDGNPTSPFYSMIGRGINISAYAYPVSVNETPTAADRVTIFENMSVTDTSKDGGHTVSLELKDPSRILQERKPPQMLIYPCSITEAVLRVCHSVGFNDISYDLEDVDPRDTYASIPYFWTDDELTAWENISNLAEATQTAVYFDEFGKLQIQTRRAAFNLSKPVSWAFDAEDVTSTDVANFLRPSDEVGKKADIVDFEFNEEEIANYVDAKWYETNPGKINRGIPEMVVAWEPEGDVVLRAAKIVSNITTWANEAKFNSADVITWPHEGKFQVNGEVIGYDAKMYRYYKANNVMASEWVSSEERKRELDLKNPGRAWSNYYTGAVRIKDRGLYYTQVANHYISGHPYSITRRTGTGGAYSAPANFARYPDKGHVTLSSGANSSVSWGVAKLNMKSGVPRIVGTKITYPMNGAAHGAAGVVIGVGSGDSGVYVELAKTTTVGDRTGYNELNVYWKSSGGVVTRYAGKGVAMNVAPGVRYELDVKVNRSDTHHLFTVYVNGTAKLNFTVPRTVISSLPSVNGFFFRGWGHAEFDYMYSIGPPWSGSSGGFGGNFDVPTIYDRVTGGYRSMIPGVLAKWAPYMGETTGNWTGPGYLAAESQVYQSNFFFDEFGLIAHEVRDFDVTFEEKPMMHSKIFMTNTRDAACAAYLATPFSAHFTLVNTSRYNAVLNGEDTMTYGSDSSIDQKMLVYGRLIKQEEPKSEISFNEPESIRQGRVELTIDNPFIQTKEHANNLADWVAMSQGGGEKSANAEVFANPHIQIGDLVAVHHPDEDMNYVHSRFFVVGKSLSYDGGLKMDITLRSVI